MSNLTSMVRWESDTRYCSATFGHDLLGDLVVTTTHGGKRNRIGGAKRYVMANLAEVEKLLQRLYKVRLRHDYELVANSSGIRLTPVTLRSY